MRILIVEAVARRQRQLRIILACLGSRLEDIHNACNLATAHCLLGKQPYDVVLVHVEPSIEATYEAIRELHPKGLFHLRVIVYGPAPTKHHLQETLAAGASGYLVYPFNAAAVESMILHPRT